MAALQRYSWPGNIRELKSLMALLAVMTNGPEVNLEDLPAVFQPAESQATEADTSNSDKPDPQTAAGNNYSLEKLEQEVIFGALTQAAGRRDRAAEMLGISRRTLIRKLKVYGVRKSHSAVCGTPCN